MHNPFQYSENCWFSFRNIFITVMCNDDKHLKHAPTPNTTSGQGRTRSAGEFTFQLKLSHQLRTEKQISLSNKWVTNVSLWGDDEAEILELQSRTHQLCYFPLQPTPGRKVCDKHGKHSPPLVKLFENGMSKWTGAIFGILDVLLSMPKKSRTEQHKCQKQESGSGSRRQEGDKSSANKKTNRIEKIS